MDYETWHFLLNLFNLFILFVLQHQLAIFCQLPSLPAVARGHVFVRVFIGAVPFESLMWDSKSRGLL